MKKRERKKRSKSDKKLLVITILILIFILLLIFLISTKTFSKSSTYNKKTGELASLDISTQSTSISFSSLNAPWEFKGKYCVQDPIPVASGLTPGDTLKLTSISSTFLCTREFPRSGDCPGSQDSCNYCGKVMLSCDSPFNDAQGIRHIAIGFYNDVGAIHNFTGEHALIDYQNQNIVVPIGANAAYAYFREGDGSDTYFDNNGGYKCTFNFNIIPACTPQCSGKQCGSNGCPGGTCGSCSGNTPKCNINGQCVQCLNDIDCSTRGSGYTCSAIGQCNQCTPSGIKRCNINISQTCQDYNGDNSLEWGGDSNCQWGCDSSTGNCKPCPPNCIGKDCGYDGCYGVCGSNGGNCPGIKICNTTGQCNSESSDIYPPTIFSISSSVTANTSTITWSTSEYSNTSVIYGTSSSNLINHLGYSNVISNHSIVISGLMSSTTYYYNITSCDSSRNCATNGTYNLTTYQSIGYNTNSTNNTNRNNESNDLSTDTNGSTDTSKKCIEKWNCGNWGQCISEQKSRSCIDTNKCNTTIHKPVLVLNCQVSDNNSENVTYSIGNPKQNEFKIDLFYIIEIVSLIFISFIVILLLIKYFNYKSSKNEINLETKKEKPVPKIELSFPKKKTDIDKKSIKKDDV